MATAALILIISFSAQAITITSTWTGVTKYDSINQEYTSPYTTNVNNFNGGLTSPNQIGLGWSISSGPDGVGDNYQFVSGSKTNEYAAPSSNLYGQEKSQYLSVPKSTNPGSIVIYFGGGTYDYLGLWWGSIDKYNKITFRLSGSDLYSISGSQIPGANASGNWTNPQDNQYVNIFTRGTGFDSETFNFDAVVISSTQKAFEFDNAAVDSVPEPGTMILLGLGLFGVGIFGRRSKGK